MRRDEISCKLLQNMAPRLLASCANHETETSSLPLLLALLAIGTTGASTSASILPQSTRRVPFGMLHLRHGPC